MREQMAAGYRASRRRMMAMAAEATVGEQERVVAACPDWTVHDLISHNVGLATELSEGQPVPADTQAWLDEMVRVRRNIGFQDQLDEWERSGPALEALMERNPRLGALLVDVVAHEHDLAQAMGRVGDRNAPELSLAMSVQKPAADADLAAHGLAAVRLTGDEGRQWVYGQGEIEVEIRASTFELYRATGGRRSRAQLVALDHRGDLERYLPGLVHLDIPTADLVE